MTEEFDPQGPPPPDASHAPLAEYTQPPPGLNAVAVVQAAVAALLAYVLISPPGRNIAPTHAAAALAWTLVAVMAASALGLYARAGWGWWLTCALYYAVFFSAPITLARWTAGEKVKPGALLVNFTLAVAILAYLNWPKVVKFYRFGSNALPSRRARFSPVAVGLALAILSAVARALR